MKQAMKQAAKAVRRAKTPARRPARRLAAAALTLLGLACAAPGRAQTRDPFLWPFGPNSIWNQPIGSGAQYHEIDLPPVSQQRTDWEYLALSSPSDSAYTWHGAYGAPDHSVVMPYNNPVLNNDDSRSTNNIVAVVETDGTVYQAQAASRAAGGDLSGVIYGFPDWSTFAAAKVTDDGGYYGGHAGSGLSVLGGSIRAWELGSGDDYSIQHAVKIELDQNELWKNPSDASKSYIWPAIAADGYTGGYGVAKNDPALAMGSLLALRPDATPEGLGIRTAAGRKLFHALQDYGAYVVDTSGINYGAPNYIVSLCEERAGRAVFDMDAQGDFLADESTLVQNLYAVSNNGPNSIGGGGTPRRSAPPPFGTLGDGTTGTGGTVSPPVITPSGSAPIGQRIAMKASANGYFVSADGNNSQVLEAKFATVANTWEFFDVVDAGGGLVALRSASTGYYVTCHLDNNDLLIANSTTTIQGWEQFAWQDLGGGSFALKSPATGYYVSCDLNDPNDALRAAFATTVQGWETFQYTVQSASPSARSGGASARPAAYAPLASPTKAVTITDRTAGATIRYTLDGSAPGAASPVYSKPLSVPAGATVKAVGFKSGLKASAVSSWTYTYSFPPAAPAGLSATAGAAGTRKITLSWGAVSGATGYRVYRASSANGTYALIASPSGAGYANTGLTAGTTYYYKVAAVNAAGAGPGAGPASAKAR
jgi:hypothetical protein